MESQNILTQLENLENEIRQIVAENEKIIMNLRNYLSDNGPNIMKKEYLINLKEFSNKNCFSDPYELEYKIIERNIKRSQMFSEWRVSKTAEKPEEVDPDKLLYGENKEIMNMKCEDFEDLVRINQQISVCMRYMTLLRELASLKFGKKFKKNFVLVQNILKDMTNDLMKNEPTDQIEMEISQNIIEINKNISRLFQIKNVKNNYCAINSSILSDEMKIIFKKILPSMKFNFLKGFIGVEPEAVKIFREVVSGQKYILIIIQTTKEFIFGTFIAESFRGKEIEHNSMMGGCQPSLQTQKILNKIDEFLWLRTFIFSFGNKQNIEPWILTGNQNSQKPSVSPILECNCGLHLYSDLTLFCQYSYIPQTLKEIIYGNKEKPNQNNLTSENIAGERNFIPSKIEIYQISPI